MARMRCCHGADLGLAEFAVERMHLAIDIRFGDGVEVEEGDAPDRRTGERLGSPRTDTADADHRDMGVPETLQGVGPIETRDAAKAALQIGRCSACVQRVSLRKMGSHSLTESRAVGARHGHG
jgi:hypothetical protein